MAKFDIYKACESTLMQADKLHEGCDIFNPAEVDETIFNIICTFNDLLRRIIAHYTNAAEASLVRIFFIDNYGHWGAPVYYVNVNGIYTRLKYREINSSIDDLNCLDNMKLPTYDVKKHTKKVLYKYEKINVYEK